MGSEAFGERPRDWSLGHAGDEGPHLSMTGEISGFVSSGGPRLRFLTRYDGEVSEPLVGRQGSRVSMRVTRGSASLLPSHGRGIWPRDVLKKVSRGLSRVEAGNPVPFFTRERDYWLDCSLPLWILLFLHQATCVSSLTPLYSTQLCEFLCVPEGGEHLGN